MDIFFDVANEESLIRSMHPGFHRNKLFGVCLMHAWIPINACWPGVVVDFGTHCDLIDVINVMVRLICVFDDEC